MKKSIYSYRIEMFNDHSFAFDLFESKYDAILICSGHFQPKMISNLKPRFIPYIIKFGIFFSQI